MITKTSKSILRILSDGHYHSGQTIANQLGLSRTAIWKAIQQLEAFQLKINSVRNKGYCLEQPIELLEREKILADLPDELTSHMELFECLEQVGSTNDYLLQKNQGHGKPFAAVIAEQQLAGRGRSNRRWLSPFGLNIYLSLRWSYPGDANDLAGLSIAAGVVATKAIKACGFDESKLQLKWPNDIYCDNKKCGGILIDMQSTTNEKCTVVIGIGINLNMQSDPDKQITQQWTALNQHTSTPISRNQLTAELLIALTALCHQFQMQGLTPFIQAWQSHDLLHGKNISFAYRNQIIDGQYRGISRRGELNIASDGDVYSFHSGEVSKIRFRK